nr:hypothetical protein [Tanacetum cinerariifolium]
VLIIHSTPTLVVPIVDEATTQNDGTKSNHATTNADNLGELTELQALQRQEQARKEEADRLGLAFPSLNPILGVGTASIGSFVSAGGTPPVSAGISAGRPSGSAARTQIPAGRILGNLPFNTTSERFPRASSMENSYIHDGLKIFDCPKSGIFTYSSYDEEFFGPDANNLASSIDALANLDWVEAMQAELQQFGNQKNKKDARGIVYRNNARLVAQGHRQEEGIDYTDVFAPVARIKDIRLFLAFASFIGFKVYQMDVKSAFLYGKITEEVYVTQPKGFEDPYHPKKVYKVVKALYGLHQAPRAWYERLSTFLLKHGYRRGTIDKTLYIKKNSKDIMLSKFEMSSMGPLTFFLGLQIDQRLDGIFINREKYVADILKKFDLNNSKLTSTPFEPQKIREKYVLDEPISVHLYRSMIRCLMYLTGTRLDIMFAVCAAARHQVTPKTSNLLSVKRIFKYLTAYPKLGLWYPRDSPFDLEAFSDSDYVGAHGDRKSTTGGSEYVAAASCCGQWFLFTSAGRVTFCWLFLIPAGDLVSAASEVSLPDGMKGLMATIDGTAYTVTEASIRSALQLDDLNAIDTITNE